MIPFLNLKSSLKSAQYPAFCLAGNDRWVKRKALATICEACGVVDDGFGVDNLDNPTYENIELSCCTPCLLYPKKVVAVENFRFPTGKQLQDTVEKFDRLLANSDGSFCLVFLSDDSGIYEKISGLAVVDCDRLNNEAVAKWIVAYAHRQGVEVDNRTARMIGEYCLQDMSRVCSETQKLIDYGEVSAESVEMLVHKDAEYVVFDLSTLIANKNTAGALNLYNGLIASGEETRGLFTLLYNTFRRAYYIKTSDFSKERLAQLFSVKPYAVEKNKAIADLYKPMQLKRILDMFDDADRKLKMFFDETEVMTTLIMQISSM